MPRFPIVAVLLLLATALAAVEPLVVYCGRNEALVGSVMERFQKDTGIPLDVRYNDTAALAAQLAAEGAESPADLFYAQESGFLGALGKAGVLAEVPAALRDLVKPAFRDPQGHWVGVTARLRVMVYNTATVKPEDLPQTLEDFADPRWKGRIGWAPANASFQAHVSLLRHTWGEEKTRAWLASVRDNGARSYPKNSPIVQAAHAGEIDIGWVNHYYLHKLATEGYRAANATFPEAGRIGNVPMVSGIGIIKHANRQELAAKLVAYLLDAEIQAWLTEETCEYPTRTGVAPKAVLPHLDEVPLAEVDQSVLTDVGHTLQMLRDLGLQ